MFQNIHSKVTVMTKSFYQALEERRSHRVVNNEIQVSEERLQEIVEFAVKHIPSAFDLPSARLVMLTGESHNRLWDITTNTLKQILGDRDFEPTQSRMDAFKAGYGTVLFFEDETTVTSLQEKFPSYAENFLNWSQQSSGMHQLVVWSALSAEGLGASLQHYNPLIDDQVKTEWDIPASWKLIAQMPFGNPTAELAEKTFQPIEERVKFY